MTVDRPEIVTTRVTLRAPSLLQHAASSVKHLSDGPLGPVLGHPGGDGLLVALDGTAGGALQAVVQAVAQQLPDVAGMTGDPVSCSISVAIRAKVQWSVSKPCAANSGSRQPSS